MAKKTRYGKDKNEEKEKPVSAGTDTDNVKSDISDIDNDSTKTLINQENFTEFLSFKDDEREYKAPVNDDERGRHFLFVVYEDSAGTFDEWTSRLVDTGLSFAVSPYHNKDVNPDGSPKKPHWHVIISYSNTTTYRSVKGLRKLTKGPYPILCKSVSGTYNYFSHKHNPEKYQYDEKEIKRFNGWAKVLEANEVSAITNELTTMIFLEDIREYAELIIETEFMDGDYKSVAQSHTIYFDRVITSFRNNPIRVLSRYLNKVSKDDERREILIKRLADLAVEYAEEKAKENNKK